MQQVPAPRRERRPPRRQQLRIAGRQRGRRLATLTWDPDHHLRLRNRSRSQPCKENPDEHRSVDHCGTAGRSLPGRRRHEADPAQGEAARWSPARLPLPTGGDHIPLDPNAELTVGEGEVQVTIPRFSLSHGAGLRHRRGQPQQRSPGQPTPGHRLRPRLPGLGGAGRRQRRGHHMAAATRPPTRHRPARLRPLTAAPLPPSSTRSS
jgi:hypothetical protein